MGEERSPLIAEEAEDGWQPLQLPPVLSDTNLGSSAID